MFLIWIRVPKRLLKNNLILWLFLCKFIAALPEQFDTGVGKFFCVTKDVINYLVAWSTKLRQKKIFCPKQTTQVDFQIIFVNLWMISNVTRRSVRGRYSYSSLSCKLGCPAVPRALLVRWGAGQNYNFSFSLSIPWFLILNLNRLISLND